MNIEEMTRDEWLEERRKGIGGSDVGVILGVNKYKSKYQLFLEKTGAYYEEVDNDAVYFGNALEDFVAQEFSKRTGLEVAEHKHILQHPEHEFMLANLDRIVIGENALLECKTASEYVKGEWDGEDIPGSYLCQVHHYLAVTGMERAYIAVLIGGNKFVWKIVERDDEFIDMLIEMEKDFWYNHVIPNIAPDIDGSDAMSDLIKDLYPIDNGEETLLDESVDYLLDALTVIKKDIKQLEIQKTEYENRVKMMMKDSQKASTDKHKITYKSSKRTTLDTDKIKLEARHLYEKYGKETTSRRFTFKKLEDK